jgi:predicted ATPase
VFLIADIRGYTAFTTTHGDEAASRLAGAFAEIIAEGVEAWSGRLIELRGDEALVAFDSPRRALLAAAELQDAFSDEAGADPAMPLRVGMGSDAGTAVALGEGYRGAVLNMAARLCAISGPGQIHASARLVRLAGPIAGLRYEQTDALELKGFGTDIRAFTVRSVGPLGRVSPGQRGPGVQASLPAGLASDRHLAGRSAEMRWLGWHWRRSRMGHGRAVVVSGSAGIGKTRLVAELALQARDSGAWVRYAPGGLPARRALTIIQEAEAEIGATHPRSGLLVVDDLEAASQEMLEATIGLAAEVEKGPALLVVIHGAQAGPMVSEATERIAASERRLELGPLDLDGVRQIAQSYAGDSVEDMPVGRILAETSGRPVAVHRSAAEWARRIAAERTAGISVPDAQAFQRTRFIGREAELATGAGLLARSRLLTLTGPPGTGKTRLALRLLSDHEHDFAHGSYFVPLASVSQARFVASAIARSLQLRETLSTSPLDVVKAYLHDQEALLVLDNFEHLLEAAPLVAELLDAAPRLRILVTSRAPLGLSAEQLYPVPPMGIPAADRVPAVAEMRHIDAVALFLERATSADAGFDLDCENAATIARIMTVLDGLPLAIELAAARIRLLTPRELLARLERRLSALGDGPTDSEARHRTMRDAIAWSYELLTASEQELFRRLGVFRGGFTAEAAADLTGRSEADVADGIESLLSKSLLQRTVAAGRGRYAMLEMIRDFAIDQMVALGEEQQTRARHADIFARLAAETETALRGEDAGHHIERLAVEADNLRAALGYTSTDGQADVGLDLASSIWRYWQSTGQLEEGHRWLEDLLSEAGASDTQRAKGYAALAGITYWQGDFASSRVCYLEALGLARTIGDRLGEADALYGLSMVATLDGDADAGEGLARQASSIYEALDAQEQVGYVRMAEAIAAWMRHDLARAQALFEASLAISLEGPDRALSASQVVGLAGIAFQRGDTRQAQQECARALDMAIASGDAHTQVFALDAIASLCASSQPEHAAQLAAATEALREAHGGGWTLEMFGIPTVASIAAGTLDERQLAAAQKAGVETSLEEAVALARLILLKGGLD